MSRIRILVTGGRDYADRELIERCLRVARHITGNDIVVVHGACPTGADAIADKCCEQFFIEVERYPADFAKLGRAAGPIRNRTMAKLGATICLAFWDGKSRGTLSMISEATAHGIPVIIVQRSLPVSELIVAILQAA